MCQFVPNFLSYISAKYISHRHSQGVQWVHLHPQGGDKNFFRHNLQGERVSALPRTRSAPPSQSKSQIFRTVFVGRVRFGGIFRRSLRATTKKSRQLFWQEKVHPPPRQNSGYAYDISTLSVLPS